MSCDNSFLLVPWKICSTSREGCEIWRTIIINVVAIAGASCIGCFQSLQQGCVIYIFIFILDIPKDMHFTLFLALWCQLIHSCWACFFSFAVIVIIEASSCLVLWLFVSLEDSLQTDNTSKVLHVSQSRSVLFPSILDLSLRFRVPTSSHQWFSCVSLEEWLKWIASHQSIQMVSGILSL